MVSKRFSNVSSERRAIVVKREDMRRWDSEYSQCLLGPNNVEPCFCHSSVIVRIHSSRRSVTLTSNWYPQPIEKCHDVNFCRSWPPAAQRWLWTSGQDLPRRTHLPLGNEEIRWNADLILLSVQSLFWRVFPVILQCCYTSPDTAKNLAVEAPEPPASACIRDTVWLSRSRDFLCHRNGGGSSIRDTPVDRLASPGCRGPNRSQPSWSWILRIVFKNMSILPCRLRLMGSYKILDIWRLRSLLRRPGRGKRVHDVYLKKSSARTVFYGPSTSSNPRNVLSVVKLD